MITKQAIGFAEKFYTLWTIQTETVWIQNSAGKVFPSYEKTSYYYQKNVSMDLDVVKKLYPNLTIDTELRGKVRSWEKKGEDLSPQIMKFGKYNGHSLDDLVATDFKYVLWFIGEYRYTSNGKYAEALPVVKAYFEAQDAAQKQWEVDRKKIIDTILTQGVTWEAEYNLRVESSCSLGVYACTNIDHEGLKIKLIFKPETFEKYFYNGFSYALPLIQGKPKKIKGKTLKVSVSPTEETYEFKVESIQMI